MNDIQLQELTILLKPIQRLIETAVLPGAVVSFNVGLRVNNGERVLSVQYATRSDKYTESNTTQEYLLG